MGDFFWGATTDRGSLLSIHCLQAALGYAFACMEFSTICHLRWLVWRGLPVGGTGWWLWRGVGLVFYDVIALGGEVLFCAGF